MAKRKNSSRGSHKGLKIFLGILAVLGVGAGATAIATKGFKQFGEAEKYIKGGVTVDTFTVDNLQKGTGVLTLIDKDDVTLTANIQGSSSDDEKLILGDKTEVAAMTKSELEESLAIYDFAPKQVEDFENQVCALDLCKGSTLSINLNVEYKKESAGVGAKELPWFDAIRVNYKIPGSRVILTANSVEGESVATYTKRINTVTPLYENINLFTLKDDATLSENHIDFMSFSLAAAKDNTVEIQSIDLIRTTAGQHKNSLCWVTQA